MTSPREATMNTPLEARRLSSSRGSASPFRGVGGTTRQRYLGDLVQPWFDGPLETPPKRRSVRHSPAVQVIATDVVQPSGQRAPHCKDAMPVGLRPCPPDPPTRPEPRRGFRPPPSGTARPSREGRAPPGRGSR